MTDLNNSESRSNLQLLLQNARSTFISKFGCDPVVAAAGPGRVNLIGEHVDYNDGFVFPMVK